MAKIDFKLFIIILNWNNYLDTRECIESVQKSTFCQFQIILVDNGSNDGSLEKLQKEYRNCIFLANENNLGYAGGNNIGLNYALKNKGDLVLILNNDTVVDIKAIKYLADLALSSPKIGMVGPMLLYYSDPKKIQAIGGGDVNFLQACFKGNFNNQTDKGQFKKPLKVNYLNGACMLIKKEIIESVGYFDENFFLYGEETDLCKRATNRGWELYIEPKAKVWHKVANSSGGEKSVIRDYYESRNFLYFIKKHYFWFIPFEFVLSIGRRLLPKILRGQWGRLKKSSLGHWHFLIGKKGRQI